MSSKTFVFSDRSKVNSKTVCHSIPCKIKTDSEAKVDTYFEPTITQSEKDSTVLLSSFRGRPLVGRTIELPENCGAFVVRNKSEKLVTEQLIDRIIHWNLDKTPSESDSLPQVIDWLKVSEAIHSPIPPK